MSENDDLERIRERKMSELAEDPTGPAEGGAETPAEPVPIEGGDHLAAFVAENDVVLADFYADWCGPCQMLEPIVAEIAAESPAAVAKVDVDANQSLAGQYGVRGVPTLVLFADGEPAERIVGVREKSDLLGLVEKHAT